MTFEKITFYCFQINSERCNFQIIAISWGKIDCFSFARFIFWVFGVAWYFLTKIFLDIIHCFPWASFWDLDKISFQIEQCSSIKLEGLRLGENFNIFVIDDKFCSTSARVCKPRDNLLLMGKTRNKNLLKKLWAYGWPH